MEDTNSSSHLITGSGARREREAETPLYQDSGQRQTNRIMVLSFVGIVFIMVLITLILSIYRSATAYNGALYLLLGLSLLGFIAIELLMMQFVKRGDLPREKTWFLYFIGGGIVLEALFTDILLFQ